MWDENSFLPFSRPSISEPEIAAMGEVLRSGWITTGARAAEFEAAVCCYTGAKGAVALASATGGMHVALHTLGIGAGDEVITPSMTWVSTVNLICLCGARPVFVDACRDTLQLSLECLEASITSRTKLIVPVHFAGAPCELDKLRALAGRRGIPLLEDAAHAIGTEYRGKRIGSEGTAIFSFHPIKNLTTGEGGMLVSDDEKLLERVRRLKFHGLGADAYDRQTHGRAPHAEVLEPGFKYNLTDMAAVLGLGQLGRLDSFIEKRAALAQRYHELLADLEEILPLGVPGYPMRHAWHLYIVRVADKAGFTRDDLMAGLKARGIGTGLHFRAVHTQKYYRENFADYLGKLPNTEWNSERICSLPLFPDMSPGDVERVVNAIKDVLNSQQGRS